MLIIERHAAVVTSVAFNPNDEILASGSIDETVILWDVANDVKYDQDMLSRFKFFD